MKMTTTFSEKELLEIIRLGLQAKIGDRFAVGKVSLLATENRDYADRITGGHNVTCSVELEEAKSCTDIAS